jgi:uncharacterized protein YfbU (UPF0304 family)
MVAKDAKPFGEEVVFPGFDGNNETEHLSIAKFMIDKLNRFPMFKDRGLNSHFPMLEIYRNMLEGFEPMRRELIGRELSSPQIIALLRPRKH